MELRALTELDEYTVRQHLKLYYEWGNKSIDDLLKKSIFDNSRGSVPAVLTDINTPFKIIDWEEELKLNRYFSDVKVGDRVWHYDRGFGTVTATRFDFDVGYIFDTTPISVVFDDNVHGFGLCFDLTGGVVKVGQQLRGRNSARFDDVQRQKLFYADDVFVKYVLNR